MLLPDGDRAVVEDAKLLDYVLNPDHPVGRHHAVLFEKTLGITSANYGSLKEQLLRAAATVEIEAGKPSLFGRKFEMRFAASRQRAARDQAGAGSLDARSWSRRAEADHVLC